jgi:hypothetical protein
MSEPDFMSEENSEREAFDRKESCPICGNYQPVGTGPCVFGCESEEKVTTTLPVPSVVSTCTDCGATRTSIRDWMRHKANCPRISHIRRREELENRRRVAMQSHPAGKRVRLPQRVLGDRMWSDVEQRWTSRGEEFA